jgi:uncharacterized protein YkwD
VARLIRFVLAATLASLAVLLAGGQAAMAETTCADATLKPRSDNLDRVRDATLCLLNAERQKRGLAPLVVNDRLNRAAQAYSRKMVREHFFAHVCPEGSTLKSRLRAAKYVNRSVHDYELGENLGWGTGSLSTPRSIVRAWMRSSGHRHSILNERFRDIGVGVAPGAPESAGGRAGTYTTEFGYRVTST